MIMHQQRCKHDNTEGLKGGCRLRRSCVSASDESHHSASKTGEKEAHMGTGSQPGYYSPLHHCVIPMSKFLFVLNGNDEQKLSVLLQIALDEDYYQCNVVVALPRRSGNYYNSNTVP